jgi:hypothetical protein
MHNRFSTPVHRARPFAAALALAATVTGAGHADCQPALRIKLTSPSAAVEDYFGLDLALAADALFVGAPLEDTAGENAGAVHHYQRVGGTWVHEAALYPADPAAWLRFGWSVAVDRDQPDTLLVGAPFDDDVAQDAGAVYVFVSAGDGTWVQDAKLTSPDTEAASYFGLEVAIDGDTAFIGAPGQGGFFGGAEGKAYVFERSGGTWTQTQQLDELTVPAGGFYGSSIVVEGDRAVIGAPYIGLMNIVGHAFVYARVAGTWALEQELAGAISVPRDRFGTGIALMGDFTVIGSPRDGPPPHGLFSTFQRQSGQGPAPWVSLGYVIPDDSTLVDRFGMRVEADGSRLAVGAANHDEVGAVYLYDFQQGDAELTFELAAADGEPGDSFGSSLGLSGSTLAAGAYWDDDAGEDSGAVYVYELAPGDLDGDGIVGVADFLALLAAWGPNPGNPADLNGDGVVGVHDFLALLAAWGPCP